MNKNKMEEKKESLEMSVLGSNGDTKYSWNVKNWNECCLAKETFDRFRSEGYAAFRMESDENKGEILHQFDPFVGTILFVPPLCGG